MPYPTNAKNVLWQKLNKPLRWDEILQELEDQVVYSDRDNDRDIKRGDNPSRIRQDDRKRTY